MPTERRFVEVPRPSAAKPHMGVVLGAANNLEGSWWVATGTSRLHDGEGEPVRFVPGSREFKSARCLSKLTYFYACHVVLVTTAEIRELPNAGNCTPEKYRELRAMARDIIESFVSPSARLPSSELRFGALVKANE